MPGDKADPLPRGLMLLLVASILPELMLQGADLGLWGSARWRPVAYAYGAFWAGLLQGQKPNYVLQPALMFATYGFLHTGALHLVGNMVTLALFGRAIIDRIGMPRFFWLYACGLLGGALGFALLTNSARPMVGASGALFGLVAAWSLWGLGDAWRESRSFGGMMRGLIWPVVLLIAMTFGILQVTAGGLAWETHLGGALVGGLLALLLDRPQRGETPD
jgi:rhomboid protease GluP